MKETLSNKYLSIIHNIAHRPFDVHNYVDLSLYHLQSVTSTILLLILFLSLIRCVASHRQSPAQHLYSCQSCKCQQVKHTCRDVQLQKADCDIDQQSMNALVNCTESRTKIAHRDSDCRTKDAPFSTLLCHIRAVP